MDTKALLAILLMFMSGNPTGSIAGTGQQDKTDVVYSISNDKKEDTMTKAELSTDTVKFYKYWKQKYLKKDTYAKGKTQYYVYYADPESDEYKEEYKDAEAPPVTVSEAHGYGMVITVSMAEKDKNAKAIFDGMYRYYRAHLSSIGPNLMSWQQGDNGKALVETNDGEETNEPDSATDGDMDIAYALLMADSVWGSDGEINYKEAAVNIINDIMEYEVSHTDWILRLGDWTYSIDKGDKFYSATRSSDFIMQYMPVFAKATGDERWMKVYKKNYKIINSVVKEYGTGILPDFIVKDSSGKFVPAPADLLESENDGNYYYNACRTPWRIGMDGLINNNKDAVKFSKVIDSFIEKKTGGDPWNIMAGYTPKGEPVSDWNDLCFDSPFLITAACAGNTKWHDEIRNMLLEYDEDVYFGDTITMICFIIDDGCWIVPEL